jgi:hypothetical protein
MGVKLVRAIDNKTSNEFIEELRQRRFREEADPLYLRLIEESLIATTTTDLSSWITLKAQIRLELPYSE